MDYDAVFKQFTDLEKNIHRLSEYAADRHIDTEMMDDNLKELHDSLSDVVGLLAKKAI